MKFIKYFIGFLIVVSIFVYYITGGEFYFKISTMYSASGALGLMFSENISESRRKNNNDYLGF